MNGSSVLFCCVLIVKINWTVALMCYSCTDLKSNEECFNVTVCPDGELCYGREDGFGSGEVKHTTGCTKELKPVKRQDSTGFTFCAQSCQGDLCNLRSCQLGNTTRSPRCLSCNFVNSPLECQNVIECKANEMCYAEKYKTFQKTKYRFGCVSKTDCDTHPIASTSTLIGKRSGNDKCSVCCKNDHCNINACSQQTKGPVFHLKSLSPGGPCTDTDTVLCPTLGRLNADACKESSVVKLCPKSCVACDHVGWMSWQPWGACSKTCEGTRTRSRVCRQRFSFVSNVACIDDAVETSDCLTRHCPVNGGWCYSTQCITNYEGNTTRSPRCLSCNFVNSPLECQNVIECKANEMCYAEKYKTFQKTKYRFGCVSKTDCDTHPIASTSTLIGKRSGNDKCSVCCKNDHCNINACSQQTKGPVFHLKSSPGGPCTDTDTVLCPTLGRLNADACKESSVVKLCPKSCEACDHVGWMPWQPWGACSMPCNVGTRTRSRECKQRFSFVSNVSCTDGAVETEKCVIRYCPVNGGWCHETKCYVKMIGSYPCMNCEKECHVERGSCDCPTPRYGGSSC